MVSDIFTMRENDDYECDVFILLLVIKAFLLELKPPAWSCPLTWIISCGLAWLSFIYLISYFNFSWFSGKSYEVWLVTSGAAKKVFMLSLPANIY